MNVDTMLKEEIARLHSMESGLVATFDQFDGRTRCRKIATVIVMLIESADRHLVELHRICAEEGWPTPAPSVAVVQAWQGEAEERFFGCPPGGVADAVCVALLRRAVHLKIPCYESARLFAFYSERPLIAQALRHALEDEQDSLERLRNAAELGVSLRAALGGSF